MTSFSITTFGCKVNAYESEAIREELEINGYKYVQDSSTADINIINTCAVTLVAEKKAREKIRSIYKSNPSTSIVVLGCYAQLHSDDISSIEGVKLVLGTKDRSNIVNLIKETLPKDETANIVDKSSRLFDYEDISISSFKSDVRAFTKIQDGCDNFCSYCIIPLTRGKSRSRSEKDILEEIKNLALKGYREIVLTGIDIGSWEENDKRLDDLVEDILNIEPKTFRLRISSLEMSQINEHYIQLYKTNPRLVPHIHIPLQAGSAHVLEMMNRKYDLNEFLNMCNRLNREIDGLALSTDVIVGFPQESEEDFNSTCEFVKKAKFMRLHVFPYSRRPFTKADKMKGQLSNAVKKERARKLIAIGDRLAEDYFLSQVGQIKHLLVEEKLFEDNGISCYRGYTENYLDLKVSSTLDLVGKVVKGKVKKDHSLEIISIE